MIENIISKCVLDTLRDHKERSLPDVMQSHTDAWLSRDQTSQSLMAKLSSTLLPPISPLLPILGSETYSLEHLQLEKQRSEATLQCELDKLHSARLQYKTLEKQHRVNNANLIRIQRSIQELNQEISNHISAERKEFGSPLIETPCASKFVWIHGARINSIADDATHLDPTRLSYRFDPGASASGQATALDDKVTRTPNKSDSM